MPLTKQQIAIKCYYEGRRLPKKPPRDRMVLDGKIKMTPRRREILFHIYVGDGIQWYLEKDWANRWKNNVVYKPHIGGVNVSTIILYLKRHKLIEYSKAGGHPVIVPKMVPIPVITPRGIDALLECVGGLS